MLDPGDPPRYQEPESVSGCGRQRAAWRHGCVERTSGGLCPDMVLPGVARVWDWGFPCPPKPGCARGHAPTPVRSVRAQASRARCPRPPSFCAPRSAPRSTCRPSSAGTRCAARQRLVDEATPSACRRRPRTQPCEAILRADCGQTFPTPAVVSPPPFPLWQPCNSVLL